jgi:uncharacterized iron-regulated protein
VEGEGGRRMSARALGGTRAWGRAALALASVLFGLGCGASVAATKPVDRHDGGNDQVTMVRGSDGAPVTMGELVASAAESDVVVVGEVHGHPVGLELAASVFEPLASHESSALSLEFFERDTQGALDDFVAGRIDEAELMRRTQRTDSSYPPGHRKMVEAARAHHRPVLAANAPRRYAKLARTEGFDALRGLGEDERRLFSIPETLPGGAYRTAFDEVMGGDHGDPHHHLDLDGFFRAQALWDDTMADTLSRAVTSGLRPVVQVVGRFHVDFDGGLLQQLRAKLPAAKVFTVSMVDETKETLAPADRGRADVVIYVGPERPSGHP